MPFDADAVIVFFRNPAIDTAEITRISEEEEAYCSEITNLGFTTLLAKKKLEHRLNTAELLFPSFSSEEMKIWAAYLPNKEYVEEYDFDNPAVTVLQAIKDASDLKIFDSIVVLDPRGNTAKERFWNTIDSTTAKNVDLIAFGIINTPKGQRWHPIVRWGNSKLLSFDEVKRFVAGTKMNLLCRFIGTLLGLTVSLVLIIIALVYFESNYVLGSIMLIFTVIGSFLYVLLAITTIVVMVETLKKFSRIPKIDHRKGACSEPEEDLVDPIEY